MLINEDDCFEEGVPNEKYKEVPESGIIAVVAVGDISLSLDAILISDLQRF